jgi:ring-1,2-phenylacetyl-CoA epoxidase subunit PaaA
VYGRHAEYRHHGVADELLDGAAVPLDHIAHRLEVARHDVSQALRVEALAERGRAGHVAEDDRYRLPYLARRRRGRARLAAARTEARAFGVLELAFRADDCHTSERSLGMPNTEAEFLEYVQSGGQVEVDDWMPDEYRSKLIKFIEMHGNSELMGVLPEREWILKAPTLQRKLALTAKVQDEVGHSQLIYRVVEDLGKPREQCLADLISGKSKFHNVFHYPTKTWGDVGVIAWLVDAAAIISQKALLKCSYAPYARIMKKICWEESFHILHGRDVVLTMMNGTDEQRELVQEAVTRWWPPLMMFHGNPIDAKDDPVVQWRIKTQGNEEARQQFLDGYVPQIWELGLTVPDSKLRKRDDGVWEYTEPDWDELRSVVTGHGPKTAERLEFRRSSREETEWVRRVVLAEAA